MNEPLPPAPQGATCGVHAQLPADRACQRCGTFMCSACQAQGRDGLCPSCVERAGDFPLNRDAYTVSSVWDYTVDVFKREWVMLSVGFLIMIMVGMVGNVVASFIQNGGMLLSGMGQPAKADDLSSLGPLIGFAVLGQTVGMLINLVVQGAVELGVYRMCLDSIAGRKADLGKLFGELKRLPDFVVARLIVIFGVGVPLVLLLGLVFLVAALAGGLTSLDSIRHLEDAHLGVLPVLIILVGFVGWMVVAMYVSLPINLATMEVVYGGASGVEALKRAWRLGDGHRFSLFGLNLLAGLIMIAGILACCVGMIPAGGFAMLFNTVLYMALRRGSGLPEPVSA